MKTKTPTLKVSCPRCGKAHRAKLSLRGHKVKCISCNADMYISISKTQPTPQPTPPPAPPVAPPKFPLAPSPAPMARMHNHGIAAVLAFLFPGLGHLYCGELLKAAMVLLLVVLVMPIVAAIVTTIAAAILSNPVYVVSIPFWAFAGSFLAWIWNIQDAYHTEPRSKP